MTPYNPPSGPITYIYVDDHLIAVDKPSGLLSVPGRGPEKADCLIARVQADYADALIVHRLDMETSGLLLLARGATMQRSLSMAFEARSVEKRYIARVFGNVDPAAGEIDLPLIADWPNRPMQKVCYETGKVSKTRYQTLAHDAIGTRIELEPATGRTHQLRVHMASIGHPILGDTLYADGDALAAADVLQLHADWLSFDHPETGARLELSAPCKF